MTLTEINREYVRKLFIYYSYNFMDRRSNKVEFKRLLTYNLERSLMPHICSTLLVTFDESIWQEEVDKTAHRDLMLNSLLDNKKIIFPNVEYNIVRIEYLLLPKFSINSYSMDIDLRDDFHEVINSIMMTDD